MFCDNTLTNLNSIRVERREANMTAGAKTIFTVKGMSCGKCAARVTKAILQAAPGAEVQVDLDKAEVTVASAAADPAALARVITEAGYPASPAAA
jgi:copper chaperone CopZ